jgi:aryl-alcohol dehydrogenase-like predicted oxidoreductase
MRSRCIGGRQVQDAASLSLQPRATLSMPLRSPMADLPKRELGRTGLRVTMLGYGAMELRGAPRARPTTEEQAETILNAVLDAGINYIDTSIDYGVSEERIGRYISHRRSEYYLASKCGCLVGAPAAPVGQTSPHVFTRDNIIAGVEQSLRRMKTDYLDVVQFHISPSKQTLEENGAIDAVMDLKQSGKVRFIGMSATLPHLKDHIAMGIFDVFQVPTQQWNASMRQSSPQHPLPELGLSFAVAPQRVRHRRISRKACSGSDGSRPVSMACVAT